MSKYCFKSSKEFVTIVLSLWDQFLLGRGSLSNLVPNSKYCFTERNVLGSWAPHLQFSALSGWLRVSWSLCLWAWSQLANFFLDLTVRKGPLFHWKSSLIFRKLHRSLVISVCALDARIDFKATWLAPLSAIPGSVCKHPWELVSPMMNFFLYSAPYFTHDFKLFWKLH